MVHKFMSYFGVPLNGSFTIERTFCDIYCFSSSLENIIYLFHFQLKILCNLFGATIRNYFVKPFIRFQTR
ncbi:hypothetical protein HanRHA438_Chr11g0498991 [Helianthus annuus]|nr:hypothetical protein HanRHA438_Chr11g0498991 [Helianthus annuus]